MLVFNGGSRQVSQRFKPLYTQPGWIVLISMLLGAVISVLYGKELNWDVAHYHYYGPYALLNNRDALDYFPPSYIHQYINPTIDFITYFFITYLSPFKAEALLGMLHGLNIALLYGIALVFIHDKPYRHLMAALLTFVGIYGPTVWSGMGSFQNDNLVAVFILFSLYWCLREKSLKLAGFVMGLGIGLKLTAGVYLIGIFAALITRPLTLKSRLHQLFVFGCFATLGLLITSGYWMFHQWQHYGNPLFPFFNEFFKSPDFALSNWRDLRFLPGDVITAIFFPFYFWNGSNDDAPSTDIRFAVLYLLALVFIATSIFKRKPLSREARFICIFFLVAYIVWEAYFSIARYLATLEMLTPIMLYVLTQQLPITTWKKVSLLVALLYTIAFMMTPRTSVRVWWYEGSFFNVVMPPVVKHTPKATVLISYTAYVNDLDPRPQTYLIPFFPKTWAFIGIPFWNKTFLRDPASLNNTLTRLAGDQPIFLLGPSLIMPNFYAAAKSMHLLPAGQCSVITSDRQAVTGQSVLLCPMKKSPDFSKNASPKPATSAILKTITQ